MPIAFQEFAGWWVRWLRLVVPLAVVCCAGCYTPGPILSSSRPNVIVFRGTAGYFPNLAEFEDRLAEEGLCPTVAFPDAHAKVAERVVAARNIGRLNGPLIVVGYSKGAGAALQFSRLMDQRHIDVDKLVLLEVGEESRVPANVRECINIYKPEPWNRFIPYFTGYPVIADSAESVVRNYNVRDYNDGRYEWDSHVTLTANPYIQDLMIDEVLLAVDRSPEHEAPILGEARPSSRLSRQVDGRVSLTEEIPPPAE